MPKVSNRAKNWVFTDYELLDFKEIWKAFPDIIKFIGWGAETCPETKRAHYQGWVQFRSLKTMFGVKKTFGSQKIHVESMRGTPEQCEKYCKKDGKYSCVGKYTTQGARTSTEEIKKDLDEGVPILDIAKEHFMAYLQYGRAWERYSAMLLEEKTRDFRHVEVFIYVGETGSGKTRQAVEENPGHFMLKGCQLRWWNYYVGQDVLIIDEYANNISITELLPLLDGYQMRLETKGGFTFANWTKVIITTNLEILHEHARVEHIAALKRRVTKVLHFD